jgi:hypothetical protein
VARLTTSVSAVAPAPRCGADQTEVTFCNNGLASGGSEGDLMRLMGCTDRSMVDRYPEDTQVQRAVDARLGRGDFY